jgi:putative effector of murein hydrolase
MFIEQLPSIMLSVVLILITICIYQAFFYLQIKSKAIWVNPLLLSIIVISTCVIYIDMPFEQYFEHTNILTYLVEPAVVALGFPLYQHIHTIKKQLSTLLLLLTLGVVIVIIVSVALTIWLISIPEIAVSLSLKSITTPIALSLSETLNGNSSITALAIILAGFLGGLIGPTWLNFINVKSPEAQGSAIGAASHAIGTATMSKISYQHAAYGSISLILSAVITAIVSPFLIPLMFTYLG